MNPYNQKNNKNRKLKRKGKLVYHSKSYLNPYFIKKSTNKWQPDFSSFSFKIKLVLAIVLILTGSASYFLFYSSYFNIKNIMINGGGRIDKNDIELTAKNQSETRYYIINNQKNLFLFSAGNLINTLKSKYSFEEISVNKKIPNTIIIDYKEKAYALIWLEDGNYYFMDEAGNIISPTSQSEIANKAYPIVDNKSSNKISENKISLDIKYLNFINGLVKIFKEKGSEYKIKNYSIDDETYSVKVMLENNPYLIFTTEEDINGQFDKLNIIKNERLKQDFNKKIYIDLRYGDRVYYK